MGKATFSRKTPVRGIKVAGTITQPGGRGEITDAQAAQVLDAIVAAIDSTGFEAEALTAVVK